MSLDEELIVFNLLNDTWDQANVAKPPIYYMDDQRTADRKRGIKIYYVSGAHEPQGLGYTSEKVEIRISIDYWSSSRNDILKMRDEIERIMTLARMSTGSEFDWMTAEPGRKLASYTGFYRYVVDVVLRQTTRSTTDLSG